MNEYIPSPPNGWQSRLNYTKEAEEQRVQH